MLLFLANVTGFDFSQREVFYLKAYYSCCFLRKADNCTKIFTSARRINRNSIRTSLVSKCISPFL